MNIKTRKEIIKERLKNGESLVEIMLSGMCGDLSRSPEYNSAYEVAKRATKDFNRFDFSEAGEYINSLVQMVDHWKELAEHYLDCVDKTKYIMDDNGYLDEIEITNSKA